MRQRVQFNAAERVHTVLCGHGKPGTGGVEAAVARARAEGAV
jgi:hypothetical protein